MRANRWYIHDHTNVTDWPGILPYRGKESAQKGQGYSSVTHAVTRLRVVLDHYAARGGNGPSLSVEEYQW